MDGGIEVNIGLFFTLSTGQETTAGTAAGTVLCKALTVCSAITSGGNLWCIGSWGHHVWLQESSFKDDMVVTQGLVSCSKDTLGNGSTFENIM